MEFPEPLRYSDDERRAEALLSDGPPMAVNMNQSIFGLIAAAGSRVDFNDRFDGSSSDDDGGDDDDDDNDKNIDDDDDGGGGGGGGGTPRSESARRQRHKLSQTALFHHPLKDKRRSHNPRLSGHRLLKSFASLPTRRSKPGRETSKLSEPTEEVEEPQQPDDSPSPDAIDQAELQEELRLAPVMGRMLEAKAEIANRPSSDLERPSSASASASALPHQPEEDDSASPLAKRLKEIFEFDKPERHAVAKSGFLSKSGKRTSKYSRYWFRLKGDVLSYYPDSTNLYFPNGQIDLRFGISADITDRDKEGVHFSLVTSHRTYNFRADSAPSAKEWVKSLQRVIFRSHNDGDSVKISLPINNIIDVEDSQMMEFSDTCKIRVIDNDETYAIDEYFFSFFSFGKEAIDLIKSMVENASAEGPTAAREIAAFEERASDASSQGLAPYQARSDTSERPFDRIRTLKPLDTRAQTTGHSEALGYQRQTDTPTPSTPTLQSITKMGAYPLQRAGAFADYLNKTSKRMSTLFATESMGYVEKVSGMWKGGQKHYGEPSGFRPDGDGAEEDGQDGAEVSMERFRAHFALPDTERLQATYFGYIVRVLPLYGKIYISNKYFCFRSLLPGTSTKLILPLKDIENGQKEKGFRFGYSGLVVVIRGHEELFFEFRTAEIRDDCTVTLLQSLESNRVLQDSDVPDAEDEDNIISERLARKMAKGEELAPRQVQLIQRAPGRPDSPTPLVDDTDASSINIRPPQAMNITCLTIGSRGDVQPYIALCKQLLKDGHRAKIATHAEFQGWIESHGIEFACVEGDPGELMRLCIENGTFTISFLREASATFRGWLDELLDSAYRACQGSDLLIESPSAMAGIHIAEKLGIPYFRAFTMPWTRTRAYPHAFIIPEHKMGGAYNYMTYVMFDNIFWKATAHQINRWRNKTLGLPNTNLEKMQPNKVPFLYNFSPSVVAPPLDFSDWIRVTGYWFLDEGRDYEPPRDLKDFIQKARDDGKKIVYVGFGSIIVPDPAKMTQEVIDAVIKADVRCILSKGWSDRITSKNEPRRVSIEEPEMPPEIHVIKSAPHDWLFRQIDAAAHHGGSGTTGASLRAGVPTIIRPFFGDQFFSASRLEDLGVGVWVKQWGTNSFGRALWEATRNERMIARARLLGERIRKASVEIAVQSIYRDMEYAKALIKAKSGQSETEDDDDTEESWTFVRGDEPDPDMVTPKLSEGLEGLGLGSGAIKANDLKGKDGRPVMRADD
ncbi:Sterol 3-beta-glucosyltransferase [Escovopsis weberi]|uniref:Sterol 3-beta-glucosyltransferase n=1 Tax=Escovopsis weberi TaxID=150374 RepID=A0A0M8N343_ESCWE|nr:Sterol 3-beta-glucosyltransferase [Escovopsis weberi]